MSATVTRLPVAMKRGRKVLTGPKATVLVLVDRISRDHEWVDPYHAEMAEMNRLIEARRARSIEAKAQQEAWIDLSRNITRWPDWARVRSPKLVESLRRGGEDKEPVVTTERQRFLEEVRARAEEIIAHSSAKGDNHG